MIHRWRLVSFLVGFVVLAATPIASADHTTDHSSEQIAELVDEAGEDMDGVVSVFAVEIETLEDEKQVDSAANDARAEVDGVWNEARAGVDTAAATAPGNLGPVVGQAKQDLQEARLTARTAISELAGAWAPPAPVGPTTTTTVPPTANGGGPPTTTPGQGGQKGNGVGSEEGNGSAPDQGAAIGTGNDSEPGTNGGGPPADPGNQPAKPDPADPAETPRTGETSRPAADPDPQPTTGGDQLFQLASPVPDQPFTVSPEAIDRLIRTEDNGTTAKMAAMLETVLSPAIADLVLSPLLVLEIVGRILADDWLRLLAPLAMLMLAGVAIFRYDRKTRRSLLLDKI